MNTITSEISPVAKRLAYDRKSRNWMAIALVVSVVINIATPIYYTIATHLQNRVIVFDLASGSLLLSPLVDPSDSKEIVEISASWAAKTLLDRSPVGLDNDSLVTILFDKTTAKKVRDEFDSVKQQYLDKSLRSHVEIHTIDSQSIGNGRLKVRVTGQVIVTGVVHGSPIQEVQPVTVDFNLARNPDLGRNKRYPLMCYGYVYPR
jgi:hypothetical protein